MIDITSAPLGSRSPLIESFLAQCYQLPPREYCDISYYVNMVRVYKDEEYPALYDVFLLKNGVGSEEHDYPGTGEDVLGELVERLLYLDGFIRYCPVRVDGKAMTVRRYDAEQAYWKDIEDMASAFTEKSEAVREAKRVAKMSGLKFIPYKGV